ncbi:MAG: ORF6N domain-containing protein [Ruminococcus sp.]|nr:ORF6N domain-containing protein [Ruminococcus sp.]
MEIININGIDIEVKVYISQHIVTFRDIDLLHNRPDETARRNFNKNISHFIEGKNFFVVK